MLMSHEGEVLALLNALLWVEDLGLHHLNFETNCKSLVDNIYHPREDHFGAITRQCKQILEANPTFTVEFVRRQTNVAHSLAKLSTHYAASFVFSFAPSCIHDNIAIEMIQVSFSKKNDK